MVIRLTIFLYLLLGFAQIGMSQKHLFSEVEIKKSSAYVGEPIEVVISAYTSTWFTKGVDIGNIKVDGAFTIYFRSVSNSMKIDGQTYAGVKLYYLVFPYDDKDLEFPSLEIKVETPDLGDYKGKSRTIITQPKTIKVKPTPSGIAADEWLVTTNLIVKETWSGNRKNIKVGDVLQRTIERAASNTLSELIPPIKWDTVSHLSLYPTRSSVENIKTKTAINGTRREGVRYLFEKEGDIQVPELVFTWWNPVEKQLFKKTLPGFKVNVQPNPDLGMLTTLQDSLNKKSIKTIGLEESKTEGFLGLSWWQLLFLLAVFLLIIYMLIKVFHLLKQFHYKRREAYIASERHFFDLFIRAIKGNNQNLVVNSMYRWLDQIELDEPTAIGFANTFGTTQLVQELEGLNGRIDAQNIKFDTRNWKVARKNYLLNTKQIPENNKWINP